MGEPTSPETIEDILIAQVEALLRGEDPTEALAASWPALRDLLALARRLYAVLVFIKPAPGFVSDLKRELVGEPSRAAQNGRVNLWPRSNAVKVIGALGLAVGAGLSFLALRPLLMRLSARGVAPAADALPSPAEG